MRLLGLSLAFGRMEMAEEDMERKIRESLWKSRFTLKEM